MSEENPDNCSFVSIHYIICECGETFPSEDALKAHLEKEHPRKRERKEYKCGICFNIYRTEDECIRHYEASHLPVGINLEHCETEDSDYEDDKTYLNETEDTKYILEIDEKKHIPNMEETEEETEEDETHPEYEALEEAIESIKEETLEENGIPNDDEDGVMVLLEDPKPPRRRRRKFPKTGILSKKQRIIVCEVCGKYYASNAALRYHQRTHTGERPYHCNFCPKSFAMPLFLQIHVRTHTGERPYQCPACPKAFSNKAALLRHDRVHSGEKPYKCPVCGKGFTQSNSMKLHVTTVHLKQPTPYKSKNRKLRAAERSQERSLSNRKTFPNRRKLPPNIDSVDVLKNGLESYVLGPLKADLENLKADIHLLSKTQVEELTGSQDEKVYQMHESIVYEMKDNNNVYEVIEEVLYEDADGNCEVVSSREC